MSPSWLRTGVTVVIVGLIAGCAATDREFGDQKWYQDARKAGQQVASATKSGASTAYQRMQKYARDKELMKTFHDTGEHSEAAVLDLLRRAGVKGRGNGTTSPGGGAKPPSGAGGKPPANTVPKPGDLPERYAGNYRWPLDAGIVSSEYGERWGQAAQGHGYRRGHR